MKKAKKAPADPYPLVLETFMVPYNLRMAPDAQPSVFNGVVSVERFRITVERIEEPVEVIHERLRKLWREANNFHHWPPLRAAAAHYGLVLDPKEMSIDRKGRP